MKTQGPDFASRMLISCPEGRNKVICTEAFVLSCLKKSVRDTTSLDHFFEPTHMCNFCMCFAYIVVAPRNLCELIEALDTWNETWADKSYFGKLQHNICKIMQYPEKGGMLAISKGFAYSSAK